MGDKIGQATVIYWLAQKHSEDQAKSLLLESLKLNRDLGNLSGIADCLTELATKAIIGGDFSSPLPWLEEARTLFHKLGNRSDEADVLSNYGMLAYWQGDYQQARAYFEESLTLYGKVGVWWSNWSRFRMALAFLRQGDIVQARETLEISLQQFQKYDSVIGLIYAIEGLASLNVNQGQPERAMRLFAWADAIREKLGHKRAPVEQDSVDKDLAIIQAKLNNAEFAKFSAEGRAMTVEEATALALEPVEEIKLPSAMERTIPSQREVEKQKYGGLTTREREVAAQIAQGKSNQAIAAELFVGLKTVEAHVTRILTKLGFTSRAQIAGWAVAKRLAEAPRDLDTLGREG